MSAVDHSGVLVAKSQKAKVTRSLTNRHLTASLCPQIATSVRPICMYAQSEMAIGSGVPRRGLGGRTPPIAVWFKK